MIVTGWGELTSFKGWRGGIGRVVRGMLSNFAAD